VEETFFFITRGKAERGTAGDTEEAGREAYREWLVLKCAVARKIVKEGENG